MIDRPSAPFVLIDDQRPDGVAMLYRDPVRVLQADRAADVAALLGELRLARDAGLHAAGYLAYGAGAALEPKLAAAGDAGMPLGWFGLFAAVDAVVATDWLPDPAGAATGPVVPRIDFAAYAGAFGHVQAAIAAGDIYQANLTFPADIAVAGDPCALYARLRAAAAGGWGALLWDGARHLLSCSPELFFTVAGDRLTARPMKGTATRGADAAADAAAKHALATDPKQRAENLMIVDLLRNDMARVAVAGSVAVPDLFTVETYPTIHQMTSTVTATLKPGQSGVDVLAATFPCGSVTGAPKIRAMEIIAATEPWPRGVYTGTIGRIAADGDAAFNVAIRTLRVEAGTGIATMGLGSGIVADSDLHAEWAEAQAKARFVGTGARPFDLIETMRFDPMEGLCDLDRHMARLERSAAALGFGFDRHDVRNELQAATFRLRTGARVRLMLARSGAMAIEARALPPVPDGPVDVTIVPLPVDPRDFRLMHKTSDRGFYDAARAAAGTWEVLFEAPDGRLTEGSFTSLFVGDGPMRTPALDAGLLPGVLRQRLIAEGRAVAADLTRDDLRNGFRVGNAVRGLIVARLAASAG
ncbi:aminodeoxychorismate synthase component I [Sphingomonas montana]|uniref:aminodeoxychorismate synthase component I n=1 Tax=Sphingomonas montana TaxID=1843236 RepID=UPI00096CC6FD|nr:aminodeoxychorismate synthase component I [Sphingomonas montana]